MLKSFGVAIAATALALAGCATSGMDDEAAEIDALVAGAVEGAPYPALAVSVRRGDEVIYEAAHGFADLEQATLATPDTVFAVGSITKSFTGLLIAQLAVEGRVDLDAPVSTYLKDYKGPAKSVAVRHLMNHTAGLQNYTAMSEYPQGTRRRFNRDDMRAFFEKKPLMFKPGDAFSYSNSGTYILGLIAEAVEGKPYDEILEEKIFKPLALERTYFGAIEPIIPGRAEGYIVTENGFENAPNLYQLIPFSAGAIEASVQDVQKYIDGVHRKNAFGDKVRDILYTRDKLNSGVVVDYALGALVMRDWEGREKIAHAGDIDGFSAYMSYYPESDISIVVLGNTRDVAPTPVGMEQKIARLVFDAPRPSPSGEPLSKDEVAGLIGDYDAGYMRVGLPRVGILPYEDGLAARLGGVESEGPTFPLIHLEGRTFIAAHDDEMAFIFSPEAGRATSLTVDWLGGGIPFERD